MAYGIEILNANGEKVLDFEKVLSVAAIGTARKLSDLDAEAQAAATAAGVSAAKFLRMTSGLGGELAPWFSEGSIAHRTTFIAVSGAGTHTAVDNGYHVLHPPLEGAREDMIFVDIATQALVASVKNIVAWNGFPTSSLTYLMTANGSAPDFVRVTPNIDTGSFPTTHGMQLFDDAGGLLFDSRAELFSIFQSFVVTQAQVQNVLETGAVVDFTLNKAAPGAKVCAPFFAPWRHDNTTTTDMIYVCKLRQINNTTIRLSRLGVSATLSADAHFYHDFSFFVGR